MGKKIHKKTTNQPTKQKPKKAANMHVKER